MPHTHMIKIEDYLSYLNSMILGNRENNELMLASCINPNPTNAIIIGSPGTSKTTSVLLISQMLGSSFAKLQATPNLDINKVLGPVDLKKLLVEKVEAVKWSNWTKAYFKFIDEFNRLTPESAVSLMELLDTTRGKRSLHINQHEAPLLPTGPLFATMNHADSATNEVFPPMLDRFDLCIVMKHPGSHDLYKIGSGQLKQIKPPKPLTESEFDGMKSEVEKVEVPDSILRYVSLLVRDLSFCTFGEMSTKTTASHEHCAKLCPFCPKIDHRSPASPRVVLSLVSLSKSLAYLRGKSQVTHDEIKSLVVPAIRHRVRLQLAYLNKFKNINDAYEDLAGQLKANLIAREAMDHVLLKALEGIQNGHISDEAKSSLHRLEEYAKKDGVYGELVHEQLSLIRKKTGS